MLRHRAQSCVLFPFICSPSRFVCELHVIVAPDVLPDLTAPGVTAPDVTAPDIGNLDVTAPDVGNLDVTAPYVGNLDVTAPMSSMSQLPRSSMSQPPMSQHGL